MKLRSLVMLMTLASLLAGCSGNNNFYPPPSPPVIPVPGSVVSTQSSYVISVFVKAPGTLVPDDMVQLGTSIFVVCQDPKVNPDGTFPPGVTSSLAEVIEYDEKGNVLHTFSVPGHPDGMVAFNATTVWVSSNEDANPVITAIDTTSNTLQSYTSDVAQLPNGGGLDDMKVINGVVYASASNPTTTMNPNPNLAPYSTDSSGATAQYGVNTGPALYAVSLNSDGMTFHSACVDVQHFRRPLSSATSPVTSKHDRYGLLGDRPVRRPGGGQSAGFGIGVRQEPCRGDTHGQRHGLYGNPWPLDDTRWTPPSGSSFMLVSDAPAQLIYRIDNTNTTGFPTTTAYSAGQGTVLQTNTTTGAMTPIIVGMNNPHGLAFVTE